MVRYIVNDGGFSLKKSDITSFDRTQTKTSLMIEGTAFDSYQDGFNITAFDSYQDFKYTGLKNFAFLTEYSFKVVYEGEGFDKQNYLDATLSGITVWKDGKISYQIKGLNVTFKDFSSISFDPENPDFNIFAGNDHVTLKDTGDDIFSGEDGNDLIEGRGGNDHLSGGQGNDQLYGGNGKDVLSGESGSDKLYGDSGNDKLYGYQGVDSLYGGTGNDRLVGGDGSDSVYGQAGNDTLYAYNSYYSEIGQYVVYDEDKTPNKDKLYGGDGNDSLHAGRSQDTLYGEAGSDVLYADFYGNTTMFGGAGNDKFVFTKEATDSSIGNRDTIKDFQTGDKINLASLVRIDDRTDLSIVYNATQKAYIVQDNPASDADDLHITVYSDHKLTATDFIF